MKYLLSQQHFFLKKPEQAEDAIKRLGIAKNLGSGLPAILPLGQRVLDKITALVVDHLQLIGYQRITLPTLQPLNFWESSGRLQTYGSEMFVVKTDKSRFCLAPTNEEALVELVSSQVRSYKDLPLRLFQVGSKFRDELRPESTLLRSKEFCMKDAYSFHTTEEESRLEFLRVRDCYLKIFASLNLEVRVEASDPGQIGGSYSEEFLVEIGGKAIEIGHIFQLGQTYCANLKLINADQQTFLPFMNCYGIGLSRLLFVLSTLSLDTTTQKTLWPLEVAPFYVGILPLSKKLESVAKTLEAVFKNRDILLDDCWDKSAGERFAIMNLIGPSYMICLGKNFENSGVLEVVDRRDPSKSTFVSLDQLSKKFKI